MKLPGFSRFRTQLDKITFQVAKRHIKNKLLVGLVVFAPFAFTTWVISVAVGMIAGMMTRPAGFLARNIFMERHLQYIAMAISIALMIFSLYLIGLFSTTIIGRRAIDLGERIVRRVPSGEFFYNTIKQIIDLLSKRRSSMKKQQRVVVIEYPRKGSYSLAFFSGITIQADTGTPWVNVFFPSTPNPTTGFLIMIPPAEVWETNLTFAQASRFIMSGGVVELENLILRSFPIDRYLKENEERKRAASLLGRDLADEGHLVAGREQEEE